MGLLTKLRAMAMRHPNVEAGVACKGTPLQSTTFTVRKKAFLFVREADGFAELRLKLDASKAEATRLAKKDPDRYGIGSQGWVKLTFEAHDDLPAEVVERWVGESYRLMAGPGATKRERPARRRSTS
jgi:predicted DNA-binding protein (MmcQ/YjbR family)